MRRTDKEINNRRQIDEIIRGCLVCHLAMARDNLPYVVPLSFGYDGQAIYLHTAMTGKKIEHFLANNRVCFCFERNVEVRQHPDQACRWAMNYQSVIGFGVISELTAPGLKEMALNEIMKQYSERSWAFQPEDTEKVRLWKIAIESLTAKESKPKA